MDEVFGAHTARSLNSNSADSSLVTPCRAPDALVFDEDLERSSSATTFAGYAAWIPGGNLLVRSSA